MYSLQKYSNVVFHPSKFILLNSADFKKNKACINLFIENRLMHAARCAASFPEMETDYFSVGDLFKN
jgi:hypothetical protein